MAACTSEARCPASIRSHVCSRLSLTRPRHGADDGGIHSLLRAVPKGQPVRRNFDAAVIGDRHIDVHVCQANIAGDSRPSFLAHPRHCPLERKGSGCEHTGSRTCCPVVAERVGRSRQAHVRGATGSGKRSRRSSKTRKSGDGTISSAEVGKTVKARAACGPACDSSSARDAVLR